MPIHKSCILDDSCDSSGSGVSFGSQESLDLVIPRCRVESDDQKTNLKKEKQIIDYLEGLGLITKTDPRSKEYKHRTYINLQQPSQTVQKYSLELVQTLQEYSEQAAEDEEDDLDFGGDNTP